MLLDIGADEGRREIAACGKAVDHRRSRAEQQVEPRARDLLPRLLGFLALGDVGPRADDLDRLALCVAHDLLPVVHPEIGAVRAADAILDRALVALEHPVDPGSNARHVVRVNVVTPEIGVLEIFARGAAEQSGDALAHVSGLVIVTLPDRQ